MVINLNPTTASDYNASDNGSGDGVGIGVNSGNDGVAVTQASSAIGGAGSGDVGGGEGATVTVTGTGTVNLNASGGDGTGNGSGVGPSGTNIMAIISHALFNGIIYLHVIYAGEAYSKWITLEEAMAFCPSGVVAYTTLQVSEVYDVPMELLFH